MNKKRLLITAITLLQVTFIALPVLADGLSGVGQEFQIPNPTRYGSLEDIINALTSLIRPVFVIAFAAMILYGGWVRLTSVGNPEKIKSSSQIIIAAIVGFAIAVFAPTVVDFIGRLLGVSGGLIQNAS